MRWNALHKQNVEPRYNGEMHHLTQVLHQVSNQQRAFEKRQKELESSRQKSSGDLIPFLTAFKLLTRNVDLPADLQATLIKETPEAKFQSPRVPKNPQTFDERQQALGIEALESPSAEPIVRNRLSHRLGELERLPSHLGTWDVEHPTYRAPSELTDCNDELKLRALLELKGLRLLSKQKSLRQHVVYHQSVSPSPNDIANSVLSRLMHRRPRTASAQDMQLTEQLERQQRYERVQKERQARLKLLESALNHANSFVQHRKTTMSKKQQFVRSILQAHATIEKEEAKKAEKTAKQRLQALRSNDEEAYIKLLDQTKDTRITHLLKQTNSFLRSLTQAVRVQQAETGLSMVEDDMEDPEGDSIDYYEVAHRIKETVAAQPSILVGGKLKEYQLKGLQWMVSLVNNNLNGILADEMGLGKTIQSISLITYLIEVKKWSGPFLVIVPLSTMTNWNVEFDKWAPSVKKIVYKGTPNTRKALQSQVRMGDFQVCLTTYEYIIKDRHVLSKVRWEHMIIDEGHRMKNTQSKLSYTLTQFYSSRYRLILTGTPLQNNLPELWALLNFVLPKIFNSVKTFDEWFNTPFTNAGGQDRMELTEEETLLIIRRLHKVLRPFLLRRLKKDVEKDLPDKVEKVVKCKMSALQAKLYEHMLKHNLLYVGARVDNQMQATGIKGLNNKIMQLRKICNHPYLFEEVEALVNPRGLTDDSIWRTAGKFELLDRILPKFRATGHRILMFFQMTQVMTIMEDYLRLKGTPYLRLDGSTKADERSEMLKKFNAPDSPYFCFLLSTRAGGLGLNLQTADTVIIFDTDWNPFQDLQAQDRAHRIGQTKEVRILRLITEESVEEAILDRALMKLEIDGKVIQAGKFDNKSTAEEQEAFLRSLMEAEDQRRDRSDEEIYDQELNEILARNEEEAAIFSKMNEERLAHASDKPRLFSEEELPEIYKKDIEEQLDTRTELYGRRRTAHRTTYDDEFIDEDADEGRRKSRRAKRSPQVDAASEAKKPKVDALSKPDREALTARCEKLISKILSMTVNDSQPPRQRASLFLELPSKKVYPDYYKIIKHPISIAEIQRKVDSAGYNSWEEFKADWSLMFANARTYNGAGSFVVKDAEAMRKAVSKA